MMLCAFQLAFYELNRIENWKLRACISLRNQTYRIKLMNYKSVYDLKLSMPLNQISGIN